MRTALRATDDWSPGSSLRTPPLAVAAAVARGARSADDRRRDRRSARHCGGRRLDEARHRALVRGARRQLRAVCCARPTSCAGAGRGDVVRYVVNRNINYTNVCYFRCQFCAFSKGKQHARTCAASPTTSQLDGNRAARARRPGSAAPPRCACRAASIPTTPARPISPSARAIEDARAGHARPCLLAAGGLARRGNARHRGRRIPAAAEGGRPRHAARHRGGDSRRRGAAPICARTS